tara:strand:+ start:8214 stop:9767 length:1554 start_codon:yes stop_codon:yes gene_type:complete
MATTATRSNYWIVTTTSNTTPVFNFKFVINVYIGGVKQAQLKQPKNNNGAAHFNIERIVKNYTKVTNKHVNTIVGTQYDSIHLMPQNIPNPTDGVYNDKVMSFNTDTLRLVTLKFYEEYAIVDGGTIAVTSSASDQIYAIMNYANEWEDLMVLDVDSYGMETGNISKFLTKLPASTTAINGTNGLIAHRTSTNDYRVISWLNDNDYFDSDSGKYIIKFYEEPPNTTYTNYTGKISMYQDANFGGINSGTATTEDEMLLFASIGGANVSKIKYFNAGNYQRTPTDKYYTAQVNNSDLSSVSTVSVTTLKPGDYVVISFTGTTDFTLIGADDSITGTAFFATGAGTGTGTVLIWDDEADRVSETLLFEYADCSKFDSHTIAWKNKFGCWDYHYFDNNSSMTINMKKETSYKKNPGSWNEVAFSLDSFERGKVQKTTGSKSLTLNTGFLVEEFNDYFKGLLQSNDVLLIQPVEVGDDAVEQKVIPLNLSTSNLKYKTQLTDKLIQYSFTFEYAHELKQYI